MALTARVTAPFMNNKMLARGGDDEEPDLGDDDDYKSPLPPLVAGPGHKIRIPPELMPDDETVLHYFDLYFTNVHPYVPVLDRPLFYQQWHTQRDSISPLLLEAVFAIGGPPGRGPGHGAAVARACVKYEVSPRANEALQPVRRRPVADGAVHRTCRFLPGRAEA